MVSNPPAAYAGTPGVSGNVGGTTLGFYGTTPVTRTAAPTQPATTASTTTTPFGYTTQAQADNISNACHVIVGALSAALGGDGLFT